VSLAKKRKINDVGKGERYYFWTLTPKKNRDSIVYSDDRRRHYGRRKNGMTLKPKT
jgi:hypothetical protein